MALNYKGKSDGIVFFDCNQARLEWAENFILNQI